MSETTTTTEEEWTTERWVFTGQTVSAGKTYDTFRRAEDLAGERLSFLRKRGRRSWVIGGVYEVETRGQSARLATASYVGTLYPEAEEGSEERAIMAGWIAADRAAQAQAQEAAAEKAAKAEASEVMGSMTLSQAATFIRSGPYATQAARTAVILKALGL